MKIITVASGKGGVGKTTLVANLGAALAQRGSRVVLFDADLGLANLDVLLNVRPSLTIKDAIDSDAGLRELMAPGPCDVRVIGGSSGIGRMLRVSRKRLQEFLLKVAELEDDTDFVIFDSSSGADAKVMTFLRTADEVMIVTTPDPASVVDAYATAKVLFRSKPSASVKILVNMAEDEVQAWKVFTAIRSAVQDFLQQSVLYAGYVRSDMQARKCVRKSELFVQAAPASPAAQDVKSLAAMIRSGTASEALQPTLERLTTAFAPARQKAA